MPASRQSKCISKRVADQDAPKKSTRSTTRNAAVAPVAAAAHPNSSRGKNTTLDVATPVIDIDNSPPEKKVGNNSTLDAAVPIININNVSSPPNAKLFQAIADELRSRPVAAPLNIRQRMFSRGLNPKSNVLVAAGRLRKQKILRQAPRKRPTLSHKVGYGKAVCCSTLRYVTRHLFVWQIVIIGI